ncbi:retrovirus group K member 113 Gag polyproteinpolyprotein-like-like [Podarcis lilfordi]|uniref:Retrovirus group K member 113 Gag polyproteinpolyprotein-like-like n=1 Tax=Podarcis lilfordi TaxID=74358 RepID=A0AA35PSX7_9SAUR|nr:retrovirus group K member 113 Gag polyproteinpolyprotein-like-like [Podarcis lilfordi]
MPSAFPITYSNPGTAQQQVFYESLPYSVMRELRKAITDSGLKSSYVTGMLEGIATGYIMLPQDWKDLMRMLLSPAQYVVFESEFKHSASALSDPQHTANQLYGAGQYADTTAQATLTPVHFSRTATCVQRAFRKVPVSGQPLSSFVNIKQQHSEPYHQFIDRLKESVTKQIDNTTAQNELMKKLAFENANTDCKKALQSIIHRPKYDLADMIQACADVGSQSHAMSLLAGAIQATNRPTGPLPPKVAGLILPKFSAAKEGIQVIPGVLDPDYVGTIMVQLWSHMPMQLKREKDRKFFAFTVPVLNNSQPTERYQWKVLPQGMLNSPTMCQYISHGTPCCLSRLSIILPKKHHLSRSRYRRYVELTNDCDAFVSFPSRSEYISLVVSLLGVPGLAVRNRMNINSLACYAAKALNFTSQALHLLNKEQ